MCNKVLTVSIAAYNVEKYLSEALDSCLTTDSDLLEVIVVNDGSSDDTLKIARNYENRFPNVIRVIDKENGGYGSTINASLKVANGKYFRYLDGDDWLDTNNLDSYVKLLEYHDSDVVYTPNCRVYENNGERELIDEFCTFSEGEHNYTEIDDIPALSGCSLTYKTSLLKQIGFRMSEHCYYADLEYALLPFSHVESIYVSKLPIYLYRIGREGQSVSVSGIERHYEDLITVRKRIIREISESVRGVHTIALRLLAIECTGVYHYMTIIPASAERQMALRDFDAFLKQYPDLYEAASSLSGRVRLLRRTAFHVYRLLCGFAAWRAR